MNVEADDAIKSGFVIISDNYSLNFNFDALVDEARENIEKNVEKLSVSYTTKTGDEVV